ncbi:MAG: imidazolonepropionase [Xanthomonadales bacterium PRO6]|nr:Imidazolonepropionase [Xanthomonadales bacterium]MCE7930549.1 imidazolonepropionase [Xanthomonadales bacterium PRO6]
MWDCLWIAPRLWTGGNSPTLVEDAALASQGGRIAYSGPASELPDAPSRLAREVRRLAHGLVTPGLIDCHTHLVFAGQRADEYRQRLGGVSYADIAARGGGIAGSVRATRAASADELYALAAARARQLIADGVTTIEIKSGYGLDLESERKMLKVARRLGRSLGLTVRTTYLALHSLPPDAGDRAAWVHAAVAEWLPQLAAEGLVDAVDAYHEGIAFHADEVRLLFNAARALNLPLRLHADQLSDQQGAALAAEFGALSADHLEYTDAAGCAALARAGTVAVLLPAAYLVLKETRKPPVAQLRAAGAAMAVATDLNPGTSPLLSLRTAMSLAIGLFDLTIEEALAGVTSHAARALGIADTHGCLAPGRRADFVCWDAETPAELCYWIGGTLAREVVAGGNVIHSRPEHH